MATIQPNQQAKVLQARRLLKRRIQQLKTADQLTAGQRDALFLENLIEINLVLLALSGKQSDVE